MKSGQIPSFMLAVISLLLFGALAPNTTAAGDVIKVSVLANESPTSVTLTSDGDLLLFAGSFDQPMTSLSRDETAVVSLSDGQLYVVAGDVRLFAEELRVRGRGGVQLSARSGQLERTFPGELWIRAAADHLAFENAVDLEAYVASVVTNEYGFDDLEGSKAMAVAARTYALYRLMEGELGDDTGFQVYTGDSRTSSVARRAVEATRGEILTFDGRIAAAVYSASSGGVTANNEDVWRGAALPYLRSKDDPFDLSSPHRSWTASLDRGRVLRALSREVGMTVSGFISGDRGPDGRVNSIELLSTSGPRQEISSNRFRLAVNAEFGANGLKSTNFDARRDGDNYIFEGAGYGHGVGLSQWGARQMAQEGHSYRDILAFYYDGVALASHRDGEVVGRPEVLRGAHIAANRIEEPAATVEAEPEVRPEPQPEATASREVTNTRSTRSADRKEAVKTERTPAGGWSRQPAQAKPIGRIGW